MGMLEEKPPQIKKFPTTPYQGEKPATAEPEAQNA
jgi:hypothetical protein